MFKELFGFATNFKNSLFNRVVVPVKCDDEPEEEEELVDPFDTLKNLDEHTNHLEFWDIYLQYRAKCQDLPKCKALEARYQECNDRVNARSRTQETCLEELFDWVQAVDDCVAKDLFKHLK